MRMAMFLSVWILFAPVPWLLAEVEQPSQHEDDHRRVEAACSKNLVHLQDEMEMLLKWEKAPEEVSETLVQFEKRLNELRSELPDDPLKAIETLMQEMFEIELAKRK